MRPLLDLRRPDRLLVLFLAAALLPAGVLVWLGWKLTSQDVELERQRSQEVLARKAVEVTAGLDRQLSALERRLPAMLDDAIPAGDALVVRLTPSGAIDHSGARLVSVLTSTPFGSAVPETTWLDAERLEFVRKDLAAAMAAYRTLAESPSADTRAGALVRLAHAQKKAGLPDRALESYTAVTKLSDARVDGDPADLFGRVGRIDLLRQLKRDDALAQEAQSLAHDLDQGRWVLSPTTYSTFGSMLAPWLSPADELSTALALAVGEVWTKWRREVWDDAASGRLATHSGGAHVFVTWRADGNDLLVFASTPQYLAQQWPELSQQPDLEVALTDDARQSLLGTGASPNPSHSLVLPRAQTGLPWTIRVSTHGTPAEIAASGRTRRGILMAGLALLAVLLPASGYLVSRAVRRELAAARQQANFVSAVSHEFRSPLTSLTHMTSLLRSDFQPTEERRREYYDVLAHESERLRRFVDTLLDFGRMRAGATRFRMAPLDLPSFVQRTVDEFVRDAASAGRTVRCTVPGPVPETTADPDALGRAVWNLLENAVKYSPDDAPVAVRVEPDGPAVAIRVQDQGAGIPDDERPHIFQQFYRGTAAIESAVRGTGVGLAVVDHVVRGHGGTVTVVSRPGEGSTFSILLPLARQETGASSRRAS